MPQYVLSSQVQSGEVVVTNQTAPLQVSNLGQLPAIEASGTTIMANSQWFVSDGTEWIPTAPVAQSAKLMDAMHFQNTLVSTRGAIGTFTRNSTAYLPDGVTVVNVNQPRYIQGHAGMGIIIEQGSKNFLTANQANMETDTSGFTSSSFNIGTGSTLSIDSTLAYKGNSSLKVVTDGSNSYEGVSINYSGSQLASGTYTFSTYINAPSGREFEISIRDITNSTYPSPYKITYTGTGAWDRTYVTFTTTGPTSDLELQIAQNNDNTPLTFHIDCAQLEPTATTTSWMPGGTSRSDESLNYPSNIVNPTEGTISFWFYEDPSVSILSGNWQMAFSIADSTNEENQIRFSRYNAIGEWSAKFTDSSGTDWFPTFNVTPGWHHAALTWKVTSTSSTNLGIATVYIDGSEIATNNSCPLPTTFANVVDGTIHIGTWITSNDWLNSYIDEFMTFNVALKEADVYSLATATQPIIDVYKSDAQSVQGLYPDYAGGTPSSLVVRDANGNIAGVTTASGENDWSSQQTFSGGAVIPSGQSLINSGTISGGVVNPDSGTVNGSWTVDGKGSFQTIDANNLNAYTSVIGGQEILALYGGIQNFGDTNQYGFGISHNSVETYTYQNFNVWQSAFSTTTPAFSVGGVSNNTGTSFLVKTAHNTLDDGSGNVKFQGTIAEVSNTSTAGNYGVATNTSNASDVELTSTSSTNVVSFTPLTPGNFLIYTYYRVANSDTNLDITLTYEDGGGSQSITLVSGVQSVGSNAVTPIMINATTSSPITIVATPGTASNCYISSTILGV